MRLLIADDSSLIRRGLESLLTEAGHVVVASAADGDHLQQLVAELDPPPDVAVLDIRMPPTASDEGARAALALRLSHPDVGILLLSAHIEAHYAVELMQQHPRGFGYLLKDRILELDELVAAVETIGRGGFVVDPAVVGQLLRRHRARSVLDRLTPREHDIVALIAEGLTNAVISERLRLSGKTVENHISSIFAKLDLPNGADVHRRVRAVLLFLDQSRP